MMAMIFTSKEHETPCQLSLFLASVRVTYFRFVLTEPRKTPIRTEFQRLTVIYDAFRHPSLNWVQ